MSGKTPDACREFFMFKDVSLADFVEKTSSSEPSPGGGSVAALTLANGAALAAMQCNLTVGKKGYEDVWDKASEIASKCEKSSREFLDFIDRDCEAFDAFMAALKMPKDTDEQVEARKKAMATATERATLVPLELAQKGEKLFDNAVFAVEKGNKTAVSDGYMAGMLLSTGVKSALLNVKINLPMLKNAALFESVDKEVKRLEKSADEFLTQISKKVEL